MVNVTKQLAFGSRVTFYLSDHPEAPPPTKDASLGPVGNQAFA